MDIFPDEWSPVRLGDLIRIKHGWAFKSEFFSEDLTGLPIVVNIGNFKYTGGFRFSSTTLKEYRDSYPEEFRLKAGEILLVMTCQTSGGEILGIPGRIPDDGRIYLHNQRMGKVVVLTPDKIDQDFLYWLFLWNDFNKVLVATATGTKILHTAPDRIESFTFNKPPLLEQRAIAHILGTLDDKIELNRRMNETLEAIARTIFKSWFVDFDPVRAKVKGRAPAGMDAETAALFPDSFEETQMGMVPKGWRVAELRDIVDVIDCLHSKKPGRQPKGKPLLQLNNIQDMGLIDMNDTYWICESDYEFWISRIEAQAGDCVITNVGRVGAVAQIPVGLKAALGRNMTALRCNRSYPFPTFLIQCLLSSAMTEEIQLKIDTGTILEALNVKNIPKLRLVLPPKELLSHFEKICRPMRAKMEQNLSESHMLSDLMDTVLPKLLSGEIPVNGLNDRSRWSL